MRTEVPSAGRDQKSSSTRTHYRLSPNIPGWSSFTVSVRTQIRTHSWPSFCYLRIWLTTPQRSPLGNQLTESFNSKKKKPQKKPGGRFKKDDNLSRYPKKDNSGEF